MQASKSSYHFGPYRLDASQRVLLRDGKPVSLTLKAFDTLIALVQRQGHVVEKEELMKQVWPDAFVEDSNLTQNIFTLRRVLGETEEGLKYIETVPRRGYRFVAPVDEVLEVSDTPAKATKSYPVAHTLDSLGTRTARFLAVLPFTNVSNDAETEYLSDGITESIINSLAQLPLLRVISRSTVFRYKSSELDAQRIGSELGVDAVLVGRVHSYGQKLAIGVELVDVANGWQLWSESYDRGSGAIFEVQDEIARQISTALRLRLSGEEERRLVERPTRSTEAYQFYLKGRFHWSKYTKEGLEQAIEHFREAIELDSNYAQAYVGIVDCYLRLATNYIPPEDLLPTPTSSGPRLQGNDVAAPEAQPFSRKSKMRQEWDRQAVERESRRALELKSSYPAAHQWHAAYLFSAAAYRKAAGETGHELQVGDDVPTSTLARSPAESRHADLTPAEAVQVFCTVAREQMDAGNFEAACLVLQRWWVIGEWPEVEGLETHSCADLLFTTGTLAGKVASSRQVPKGQKHAEALLNGSIALFEQLGLKTRGAEGRIELAYCYYRERLFDFARSTLQAAIRGLPQKEIELRSMGLIVLAIIECASGRPQSSFELLTEVAEFVEIAGPRVKGRYHLESAVSLKDLGVAEKRDGCFDFALKHYQQAIREFEAIGNHRFVAIVENNHGYLLLIIERLDDAYPHLIRARRLFEGFADKTHCAQVDETLAQLHLAANRPDEAEQAIKRAVARLQIGGEEAVLAEALTTQGVVLCRLGRQGEAKRVLERASRVAESCGDPEGAGQALLVLIEEMAQELDVSERLEVRRRLEHLLCDSERTLIRDRLRRCLAVIDETGVKRK